jgi:nucleotide-binding universal stress UspA family protein
MFTKILVPTDFSSHADTALEYARALATQCGASFRLLHVMTDPTTTVLMTTEGFLPDLEQLKGDIVTETMRQLNDRLTDNDRRSLGASTEAFFGTEAPSIVAYAREHGFDLIVMGTHGRTGMAHVLMGSVAEHVVRTAPCAVLTIRHAASPTEEKSIQGETVAVRA